MRKINLITILATVLFTSPHLAAIDSTIEPLDPTKAEMLVTYEIEHNVKAGTKELLFHGIFTSVNKKPNVHSVMDVNTRQSFMAKAVPYKKDDKTIPGKYKILIRFKEPLKEDYKFLLQSKIAVYNNDLCYINDDGLWVTKWRTSYPCEFIAPKGHIPVFTSLPVEVSESFGRIHLLQDPLFIKKNAKTRYARTLIFKTKPPYKKGK